MEKYAKNKIERNVPIVLLNKKDKKEKIETRDGMIPFDEFQKLELVAGTILSVSDHPNANKLYVLEVDLGKEKRQMVAGLK
ncbi:MAG: Methionine-tRNA ligase, partial [Candidatus Magasanikbacteria bacterium GW2011_GWA2_56_11]